METSKLTSTAAAAVPLANECSDLAQICLGHVVGVDLNVYPIEPVVIGAGEDLIIAIVAILFIAIRTDSISR